LKKSEKRLRPLPYVERKQKNDTIPESEGDENCSRESFKTLLPLFLPKVRAPRAGTGGYDPVKSEERGREGKGD